MFLYEELKELAWVIVFCVVIGVVFGIAIDVCVNCVFRFIEKNSARQAEKNEEEK